MVFRCTPAMATAVAVLVAAPASATPSVGSGARAPRAPDPIPPLAVPISLEASWARVPLDVRQQRGVQLVLDRRLRQVLVLRDGVIRRRYPAAVGTEGWEPPAGRHRVLQKVRDPLWTNPVNGRQMAGANNPLGTRWIGFHRDCNGRSGWDGEKYLTIEGCTVVGFHGTPRRWTVGRAVSHGCVRLYDEHVQEVFDLVQLGTPVTVLS
ncbi:MAG: L,D-transpeptidase [Synechococcus sp.]